MTGEENKLSKTFQEDLNECELPDAIEKVDRVVRFKNEKDILRHIKQTMTERGNERKKDVIEQILAGQSEEDREAILRALLYKFSGIGKKDEKKG